MGILLVAASNKPEMDVNLDFDVVVVGAGIEGSATAYCLAKDNYKTLLLDQVSNVKPMSHFSLGK